MTKKVWKLVMRAGPLVLLLIDSMKQKPLNMVVGFTKFKKIPMYSFISVLLIAGTSMNAYAFLGFGDSMSWNEEVLLHDGTKMVVERFYHLGGKPTLDSQEQRALDETVSFILRGSNKKIIWKTDFRDSQPEPNSLNLLGSVNTICKL